MLTPEQKAAYLADSGKCPICGSPDIAGDEIQAEGDHHYQTIECQSCDASWVDVYTLSDIEMDEPSPDCSDETLPEGYDVADEKAHEIE